MAVKQVQAILQGQTYNLTLNTSTGKYEATITAPSKSSYGQSGHYYGVTVKASDTAGNIAIVDHSDATLGNKLQLKVEEKVAPVITISSPSASALLINNKPQIAFTVTDNDSGVNVSTIKLKIDGGTDITDISKTAISGGYTCTYTPTLALSDGSHTVTVNATDNDGNAAAAKSVTFKIDTVPPTLSVTAPVDNLITNNASVTVSGVTNDVTSSPVTLTIKHNNGTAQNVTVGQDGAFSKALTLVEGTNTILVTATDGAGKVSTVTRTVILDTAAPVITGVTLTPNPVDAGKTFTISISVTD